jgi:5-formyltetrahydrofolate cyclo-ligase
MPPEPEPAGDPKARKAALRRAILARRDGLPASDRAARAAAIFARVAALPGLRAARVVLAYAAFGSEPDTGPFLRAVLAAGKALVLPRVNRATRMLELYRVEDPALQLEPGTWGIREPRPALCAPVAPAAVDFVLVPGVAFDVRGGRIGYGGGYYDRLLGRLAPGPLLVAAAFDVQVVPEVPMTAGDRRMDRVVTESRTYPE